MPTVYANDDIAKAANAINGVAKSLTVTSPVSGRLMTAIGPAFIEWMLREQAHDSSNAKMTVAVGNIFGFLTAYAIHECPPGERQAVLHHMSAAADEMMNLTLTVLDDSNEELIIPTAGNA